jgi:tetratricopeptide (TPR) repeat protein
MSRLESDQPISYKTGTINSAIEKNENQWKFENELSTPSYEKSVQFPFEKRKEILQEFDSETNGSTVITQKDNVRPEVYDALINAQRLFNLHEVSLAKNLYKSVLKVDSLCAPAMRGLAQCCRALRQDEEAVSVLRQLAHKFEDSENFALLGDILYDNNYNEEALINYLKAVPGLSHREGQLFGIYKNIGNIHLRLGDVHSAEENYNKAYTLSPDSDVLRVNFGSLALFNGDLEKALLRFREAVQINDRNDKAWSGLAVVHRSYGDQELSWANIEKALDINPANDSAIKLVCDWAMKDNEIEIAIFRLKEFMNIHSEDFMSSLMMAKFMFYAGRLAEAAIEAEKALCLSPDNDEAAQVLDIINEEVKLRK